MMLFRGICFSILLPALLTGCDNAEFKSLSASLLSKTGYVSSSQVESALSTGGKLIKTQEKLTAEQEYFLGRAVSATLLGKFTPVANPELLKYVNRVGGVVAGVSDTPETFGGYHFIVINSPQINAMSAPGGFVFVSTGFLKLLPDEDCLAAVLAHEVGHVVKKHGANAISNAGLFSALADVTKEGVSIAASRTSSPVDLGPITQVFSGSVSGVVDKLLTKGFDRSQEYEADLYAANLLEKAGYDPTALFRVLTILEKQAGDTSDGWYATHPAPSKRIDELKGEFTMPKNLAPINALRVERFNNVMR